MTKIVVIGKGEFGNSLTQGLETATIPASNATLSVEQISATKFFSMSAEDASQVLTNASFVMYCGRKLSENASLMAAALQGARNISSSSGKAPLLQFIDWSNPDPQTESYDGAVAVAAAVASTPDQIVWKVTGLSSYDVSGHTGNQNATVYTSSTSSTQPALDIPGIVWQPAPKNTLSAEVAARLMTRAEVERWYDAAWLSFAVYATGFGYVFARYSQYVNGKYPDTMIPLYIADKAFGWTALWMMSAAPFAGNLLAIMNTFSGEAATNGLDTINAAVCAVIMAVPVFSFIFPWVTWALARNIFTRWEKSISFKSMLVDLVSLKTETGVISFFFLMTHAFMGSLVAIPQYKSKWFDADNKGRFYGNYELSLACGVIAFVLVTLLTIRSLIKEGSWMKLKPVYNYVSPLAILLATFHLIFMGYKGWNSLFNPASYGGQPSPTFASSMFSLGVVGAHIFLMVLGTKKRARKGVRVEKHSAIEAAFAKYNKSAASGSSTQHVKESFHEDGEFHDA